MSTCSKDQYKIVFGEEKKKEVYQLKGHSFSGIVAGKQVCSSCSLVGLNNDFTRWAIDKGCYYEIHPEYKSAKKRFTKTIEV